MSDEDSTLEEKRVYGDRTTKTTVFVGTALGVVRVEVSGGAVGEFGLERRGPIRDVAGSDGRLAVGTSEDVLVGTGETFDATGFGPADAVGYGRELLAAGEGHIGRFDGEAWTTLGELEAVRAVDGELVAAASGIHRLDGTHLGLTDATDVTASPEPLAATRSGLYRLGNGWMKELDGEVTVVATDGTGERAHAAREQTLYEHRHGEWQPVALPLEEPIAGVAYGPATYVLTEPGTFLADAGDGWRMQSLGVSDVTAVAVP